MIRCIWSHARAYRHIAHSDHNPQRNNAINSIRLPSDISTDIRATLQTTHDARARISACATTKTRRIPPRARTERQLARRKLISAHHLAYSPDAPHTHELHIAYRRARNFAPAAPRARTARTIRMHTVNSYSACARAQSPAHPIAHSPCITVRLRAPSYATDATADMHTRQAQLHQLLIAQSSVDISIRQLIVTNYACRIRPHDAHI